MENKPGQWDADRVVVSMHDARDGPDDPRADPSVPRSTLLRGWPSWATVENARPGIASDPKLPQLQGLRRPCKRESATTCQEI